MLRMRLTSIALSTGLLALGLLGCQSRVPPIPEHWASPALPPHQPLGPLPPASGEAAGEEGSLLSLYAEQKPRSDEEIAKWGLPFQAKTMIVEMLIAVVRDDVDRLHTLLTEEARWGTPPDRREFGTRKIFSESDPYADEFVTVMRKAASRFSSKSAFSCTPLQPGWQMYASSGAEPVWCTYSSKNGLDIIAVRIIVEGGRVKTDYVGLFPDQPTGAVRVVDQGDPPPLTPYLKRPVSLAPPELMPDGSNPVLAKPKR